MAANPQPRPDSPTTDRFHLEYVTHEELEMARQDPAWEARRGIAAHLVCRECGAKVKYPLGGKKGHLWRRHDQMTVRAYRVKYPGAVRLFSFTAIAKLHGYDVQEYIAKFVAEYLTPEELLECRQDPEYETHHNLAGVIVCRECGWKSHAVVAGGTFHLGTMHDLNREEYLAKYPGAPMQTAERMAAQNRAQTKRLEDPVKKEKKKAAHKQWAKDHPVERKAQRARHNDKPEVKAKKKQAWAEIKKAVRAYKEGKDGLRRKSYTHEQITDAIASVRKMPYAAYRTAMVALNVSRAQLFRYIEAGKLKRQKKGFVYSAQVLQMADRGLAQQTLT